MTADTRSCGACTSGCPATCAWSLVNAHTGVVEREGSLLRTQLPDIGTGGGVFGDAKKVPAAPRPQGFQLRDSVASRVDGDVRLRAGRFHGC